MSHDMHEATEVLLLTAREFASSNAARGDVVAASYRHVAAKIREHGYADLASQLERYAEQAEKVA